MCSETPTQATVKHPVHEEPVKPVPEPAGLLLKREYFFYYFGLAYLISGGICVACTVGATVLWDFIDRLGQGKPLEGYLFRSVQWFNRATHDFNKRFVRREEDSYIPNAILVQAIMVPSLFLCSVFYTRAYGLSLAMAFAYHVFRLGPYFMNFAYVYTLCHKEGHTHTGLYSQPYNNWTVLRKVFNWWIGLFYGVMPSSFVFGHSINHHRYNNGPQDVVTTADKARDSFTNFVAYVPRFTLYASNISTIIQFSAEKNWNVVMKMIFGTVYYWAWFALWADVVSLKFALVYLFYPFVEQSILLSCINWCWHAFLDPNDPEDEYVGSTTILDGPINVLEEDFHVVHHQYPGTHWTRHPAMHEKHQAEYAKRRATVFRGTHVFELFVLIVIRDYDKLVDLFVDLGEPKLSREGIKAVLQSRLRACWWGPRANLNVKLQGKEVGNYDDGKGSEFFNEQLESIAKKQK